MGGQFEAPPDWVCPFCHNVTPAHKDKCICCAHPMPGDIREQYEELCREQISETIADLRSKD